jgi:hypothetical protein
MVSVAARDPTPLYKKEHEYHGIVSTREIRSCLVETKVKLAVVNPEIPRTEPEEGPGFTDLVPMAALLAVAIVWAVLITIGFAMGLF